VNTVFVITQKPQILKIFWCLWGDACDYSSTQKALSPVTAELIELVQYCTNPMFTLCITPDKNYFFIGFKSKQNLSAISANFLPPTVGLTAKQIRVIV